MRESVGIITRIYSSTLLWHLKVYGLRLLFHRLGTKQHAAVMSVEALSFRFLKSGVPV